MKEDTHVMEKGICIVCNKPCEAEMYAHDTCALKRSKEKKEEREENKRNKCFCPEPMPELTHIEQGVPIKCNKCGGIDPQIEKTKRRPKKDEV